MNKRDGPLLDTLMKNNMSPSGGCSIEHPLGGGGKGGAGDISVSYWADPEVQQYLSVT